jgi:hypothetical protein
MPVDPDAFPIKYPYFYPILGVSGRTQQNEESFTELWRIVFENHKWSILDFSKVRDLPQRYSAHPNPVLARSGFYLEDYTYKQNMEAEQVCDIELIYSNKVSDQQQIKNKEMEFEPDPTKRPPIVNFGTYTVRENQDLAYEKDTSDEPTVPIQTTAMEPLLFQREFKRRSITIEMAVAALPPFFFDDYECINADKVRVPASPSISKIFHEYPPYTLKLTDMSAGTEEIENNFRYFKLTILILHNPRTWLHQPRNVGRQHFELIKVLNPKTKLVEVKRAKVPTLIRIGTPQPELPANPLPLRNLPDDKKFNGTLFPDYINFNQETGQLNYDQDAVTPERLREIYKEATLKFRVYRAFKFTNLLPGLKHFK